MNKTKLIRTAFIICTTLALLSIISFLGVGIAHSAVFARIDYDKYDFEHHLLYQDLDKDKYPREKLNIQSDENTLSAYMYGEENSNGLIVISPGHGDANDIKLYEITYFVDNNLKVLCFDYTGSYNSQGNNMVGYTQSVHDLNNILKYIETDQKYKSLPIVLFGHSLGGYASAAVLQYGHKVNAAIIASGFDTPREQWLYSIKRYTGAFHHILEPFTRLFISHKYGKEQNLSAVDGINSVDIPVLVISGADDEFYGGASPIYIRQDDITNPNCSFEYKANPNHDGHYDYFLSDEALQYKELVKSGTDIGAIDKNLYFQHDFSFMAHLNEFLLNSINK